MRVLLFANGEIDDYGFIRSYLNMHGQQKIICCDGGLRHTDVLGIMPDCCIGDLDSAEGSLIERYKRLGVSFIVHPSHKDQTDLELAIEYAIETLNEADGRDACEAPGGAHEILIFGWRGGRFDHELTNAYILFQAVSRGIVARLVDDRTVVWLAGGSYNSQFIDGHKGDLLSLIPLTPEVTGIVTEGLLYPLCGETLYLGYGRGISNVLDEDRVSLRIESGILMIVWNRV